MQFRPALQADFIKTWGQPLSFEQFNWRDAWLMTREIVKNHSSRSWQCLAGYTIYPNVDEQLIDIINRMQGAKNKPFWMVEDKLTSSETVNRIHEVNTVKRQKLKALLGDIG